MKFVTPITKIIQTLAAIKLIMSLRIQMIIKQIIGRISTTKDCKSKWTQDKLENY